MTIVTASLGGNICGHAGGPPDSIIPQAVGPREGRESVPAQPGKKLFLVLRRRLLEPLVRSPEQAGADRPPGVFLLGRLGAQIGVYSLDLDGNEIWHAHVRTGTHGWGE